MWSPPQGYVASSVIPAELWYNVRDYGAVGNGTTDDTVAIQAALTAVPAAGGTVYIPPNTYKITAPLTVKSFTHLFGVRSGTLGGSGGSILAVTGAIAAAIQNVDQVSGNSGIVLDSFVIQGGSPAIGISFVKVKHSIIEDIYVNQTTAEGIKLNQGQINWIARNFCQNIGTDGISLIADVDDLVEGNQVTATSNGLSFTTSASNNLVRNNFGFLCGANGALNQGRNVLTGNRFNNNGTTNGSGLNVSGANAANSIIMGNLCYDNGVAAAGARDGILIDTTDVLVVGNRCFDSGPATQQAGIHLGTSANFCTISDNDVRGNVTQGLRIDGILTGNVYRGNIGFNPGMGVSSIVGSTLQKSESAADTNVLTYTPPILAGNYRLHVVISVSAATAATLGWTATWKDSNGTAQAPTNLDLIKNGVAAPALTFVAAAGDTYCGDVPIDIDNSATNIVVKLTFTGTSFTAKMSAIIEQLA